MKSAESSAAPWRSLYPFEHHEVRIGEHRCHYVDEGKGDPVVMVHGNPTWSFMYRELIRDVADAGFRAVAPDHIGCGLSDKPDHYPYRLQNHIDNLEHLLDRALEVDRLHLVVHDWGGAVATGYAARHPERIASLTVLNTAAFLLLHCPLRIRICRIPLFGALAVRGCNAFARAAARQATTQPGGLPPPVRGGYLAPYNSWRNRIAILRFVQDIPLRPDHPTYKTVQSVGDRLHLLGDRPMLICWGMQDFCFDQRFLAEWRRRFPDAHVHPFENAGHYVLEDAGDTIRPLVTEFLSNNSTSD